MTPPQRAAAMGMARSGLSRRAYGTMRRIIGLEPVLWEEEAPYPTRQQRRDPGQFAVAIFGQPAAQEPWMWRVEGHHISLRMTSVPGFPPAAAPQFLGAAPALVQHGRQAGLRTLGTEEDLGRDLLRSLNSTQRATAVVSRDPPADILTGAPFNLEPGTRPLVRVDPAALPHGIRFAELDGGQRTKLVRLVKHYVNRQPAELARSRWMRIRDTELPDLAFAWAGQAEPGRGHYYSVRGRTFLLEYDNTQQGANHVHTVWREFAGEWGDDALAQHYSEGHRDHRKVHRRPALQI
jgi:hypothetical protein